MMLIYCCIVAAIYFDIESIRQLKWHRSLHTWNSNRYIDTMQAVNAINAVESHDYKWGRSFEGRFGPNGPGGGRGIAIERDGVTNELNYETLCQMVMIEQDQRALIKVAIDHLKLWEYDNPRPLQPIPYIMFWKKAA